MGGFPDPCLTKQVAISLGCRGVGKGSRCRLRASAMEVSSVRFATDAGKKVGNVITSDRKRYWQHEKLQKAVAKSCCKMRKAVKELQQGNCRMEWEANERMGRSEITSTPSKFLLFRPAGSKSDFFSAIDITFFLQK